MTTQDWKKILYCRQLFWGWEFHDKQSLPGTINSKRKQMFLNTCNAIWYA